MKAFFKKAKKGPGVSLCRFKICKQNLSSINHLSYSTPRVSPYISEKWSENGRGRPKISFFSKNEKIVKNYQREDPKKTKISKKISDGRTYVRTYIRTDARVQWRQYPIRSNFRGVIIMALEKEFWYVKRWGWYNFLQGLKRWFLILSQF